MAIVTTSYRYKRPRKRAKSQLSQILGGLLAATMISTAQADPNQYLCILEHASGLQYDLRANAWTPQVFLANQKYILRRLNDEDWRVHAPVLSLERPAPKWGVFEFGEKDWLPVATCREDLLSTSKLTGIEIEMLAIP